VDLIRIEGIEAACIVGVRPQERSIEQRVRVDLLLGLDLSAAGRSGRIAHTCDYDQVTDEVIALLRFRRYRLIEMATEELAAMLMGVHDLLERVDIRLEKPAALDGRARSVSIEVARTRAELPRRVQGESFGAREVLLETREAGLYLYHVDAGGRLPGERRAGRRHLEWPVCGELRTAGDAQEPIAAAWHNPGPERATLFRCSCET
jgi:dihydroneopterin aldolase